MPKYTKEEKAQKRIDKIVDDVLARAQNGEFKKHADYHGDTGHAFTDERVLGDPEEPRCRVPVIGPIRKLPLPEGQ
ncbi:hypothetical protein [Streptomyces sp. NPDC002402]